jgi:hypothetical protein
VGARVRAVESGPCAGLCGGGKSVQIWRCVAVMEGERGQGAHGLGVVEEIDTWAHGRAVLRRIGSCVGCSWADIKS